VQRRRRAKKIGDVVALLDSPFYLRPAALSEETMAAMTENGPKLSGF
jgi:hypothetical protein